MAGCNAICYCMCISAYSFHATLIAFTPRSFIFVVDSNGMRMIATPACPFWKAFDQRFNAAIRHTNYKESRPFRLHGDQTLTGRQPRQDAGTLLYIIGWAALFPVEPRAPCRLRDTHVHVLSLVTDTAQPRVRTLIAKAVSSLYGFIQYRHALCVILV